MSIEQILPDEELMIFSEVVEHLFHPTPVEMFDFTLSHLIISQPSVYGLDGFKETQSYTLAGTDKVMVKKTFTYNEGEVLIKIEWMDKTGENVGLRKVITKPINKVQRKALQYAARQRILYSIASTIAGSPIEPYYNQLLEHYQKQVELYIIDGTSAWLDAINAEPETIDGQPNQYYQYLQIDVGGLTVKDYLLRHLTA